MFMPDLDKAEREELCDEWSVIRRSCETETDDVEVVRYYEY